MEEHSRTLYEDLLGSIEKTTVGGGIQTGSKKKKKKKKKKSKSMVKQVADAPDNDNVGVTLSLDKKISAEEIAVGEIVGEKFEDVNEQDNVEGEAPTQVDVDVTKPVVSNSPSSIASVALAICDRSGKLLEQPSVRTTIETLFDPLESRKSCKTRCLCISSSRNLTRLDADVKFYNVSKLAHAAREKTNALATKEDHRKGGGGRGGRGERGAAGAGADAGEEGG